MNYKKHYDLLIERGKNRILKEGIYSEKHHIIPKCLGGDDSTINLVKLTADEHFVAHLLLAKIYKSHELEYKLIFAANMMTVNNGPHDQKRNNNKQYSWLREAVAEALRKVNTGRKLSNTTRNNMSKSSLGKPKSAKHRENMKGLHDGRTEDVFLEMFYLRQAGFTMIEIADLYSIHEDTVYKYIKNAKKILDPENKCRSKTYNALNKEQLSQLIIEYINGASIVYLSETYNICKSTITKYLRKNNAYTDRKPIETPEKIVNQIITEYINGIEIYILVKKYNLCRSTIYKHLKRANVFKSTK